MVEVYRWCVAHYELIIAFISLAISIVFFILKKKTSTDIFTQIYNAVIRYVKEAEEYYKDEKQGLNKFTYVMQKTTQFLRNIYPDIKAESYCGVIGEIIEEVLSTPQKKGE